MKDEREHIIIETTSFQDTLNRLYELSKLKGFKKENSLFVTIHSLPGEAPSISELASQVREFIAPAKFEFIYMGQYLESSTIDKRIKDDFRSTTHLHCLFKGKVSELEPFAARWNKKSATGGVTLFQVLDLRKDVYSALMYPLRDLHEKNGFVNEPCGAILQVKKTRPSVDWLSSFVVAITNYLIKIRQSSIRGMCHSTFLDSRNDSSALVKVKLCLIMCLLDMPNAPPPAVTLLI